MGRQPRAAIGLLLLVLLLPPGGGAAGPAARLYVTNENDDSITVLDPERQTVLATVAVGARPRGIKVSPDGRRAYVALGEEDVIEIGRAHV